MTTLLDLILSSRDVHGSIKPVLSSTVNPGFPCQEKGKQDRSPEAHHRMVIGENITD